MNEWKVTKINTMGCKEKAFKIRVAEDLDKMLSYIICKIKIMGCIGVV